MLAMLWLELVSPVFNGCGFDPFGLQAQSSQSKISGLPLFFPGRQVIPLDCGEGKILGKANMVRNVGESRVATTQLWCC